MNSPNTPIDSQELVPKITRKRGIPVVWTLPILAIALCLWLLFTSWRDSGVLITITFANGNGLVAGKTQVVANGIPVGLVKELSPDLRHNAVKATVEMRKETRPYLLEDTLFWVVRPELSAAGVQGLETFISGIYIGIRVGTAKQSRHDFVGLDTIPPVSDDSPGLHITLTAKTLGSLQNGSGVYFKDIEIGAVQAYRLKDDQVEISVCIKPEYAALARQGSRFYQAGNISIGGSLTDLKVHLQSLTTLLRGGIMMFTPESLRDGERAGNGQVFSLFANAGDAGYGLPLTIDLPDADGVGEGTKLVYHGVEAGRVRELRFEANGQAAAMVSIDPKFQYILKKNTRFWLIKPSVSVAGISHIQNLITGAQLTFQPGDGPFSDHFCLAQPPPTMPTRPGKSLTLTSDAAISLRPGSPVTFKDMPIGEVVTTRLTGETISVDIFIEQEYEHLLGANTLFWLRQALEIKADWSGLEMKTGTVGQMLLGGIAVSNPPKNKKQAAARKTYPLYADYQAALAAHPESRPPGKRLRFVCSEPQGISKGTPVLYKNIAIGQVENLSFSRDRRRVLIDAALDPAYGDLLDADSRCYPQPAVDVSGSLSGISLKMAPVAGLLRGGIACLETTAAVEGNNPPREPLPLYATREEAENAGNPLITIRMKDIGGLREGAPLRYRGVDCGQVLSIRFADAAREIVVEARMKKEVASLLRQGSRFWLAKTELGLDGLRGADALLGGYLLFLPGTGPASRQFVALDEPPQNQAVDENGLSLVLEARQLASLVPGSPVYFRQVQVGEVTGARLAKGFDQVFIAVRIAPRYAALIRQGTQFWNVSGIRMRAGLFSGVNIKSESLTSLVKGGIALATPPDAVAAGNQAADGAHFTLREEMQTEWQDWLDAPDQAAARKE
ncbi:MAG: MlaD family protein [Desulfobulbaceae bacterium]|jgi:paraquat-inducible protein B|nr:MlaD family protein [Desulfobulbaceae bacterium]